MSASTRLTPLVTPVGTFVPIPGGPFQMGSAQFSNAQPVRTIDVSTFYIGETVVTNRQFDAFRATPSGLLPKYALQAHLSGAGRIIVSRGNSVQAVTRAFDLWSGWLNVRGLKLLQGQELALAFKPGNEDGDPEQPATKVDWATAHAYAVWAGKQVAVATGRRFVGRLAREAEWEKAARGGIGAKHATSTGKLSKKLACYGTRHPAKVKSYPPNPYGVYDLSGGVRELCEDWYGPYAPHITRDPVGPESGFERVLRGGSYEEKKPDALDVGFRFPFPFQGAFQCVDVGFRVVVRVR